MDIVLAGFGLVVLSPLLAIIAVAIKLDSHGPVLFKHVRLGRQFRTIQVFKFRTMAWPPQGPELTGGRDGRITRVGRVLRRTKLDEVPQLANVLIGNMSLVGPRPEVPRYVSVFRTDYEEILRVRPGVTGPAALKYRSESELLEAAPDPEVLYLSSILPNKIELDKAYVRDRSLLLDIRLLVKTVTEVVRGSLGNSRE